MKSNVIKTVVIDAQAILDSGDFNIMREDNRILITRISKTLNAEYRKNPKTVSAIIQYICDHGYQLTHNRCTHTELALTNAKKVLEKINPKDLESIRSVCESMFAQHKSKS